MSCENVQPLISSLIDRRVAASQREEALAHLDTCRACSAEYESTRIQRTALRSLAEPSVPAMLQGRLRVLASHERARQLARINWMARAQHWRGLAALRLGNLMRPVALPVAGGLVSALLMFAALIPSVTYAHFSTIEPPSPVFTDPDGQLVGEGEFPKLERATGPALSGKVVVLLTIDDRGHVQNYTVTQGVITPEVQNFILFSQFTPAMFFGKPTWGQIRAVFGADNDVRS
jgi:Putative zinc-finger